MERDDPDTAHGSEPIEERLVHRADLDGLIRLIDDLTDRGDFVTMRRVRDRCRDAVSTGRQLWPAATLAQYRIALLAPAAMAVDILDERSGRFTIGPLSEVIAQNHTWSELSTLLPGDPIACSIAHERAIRGEVIDPDSMDDVPAALDIAVQLQSWEPHYRLAEYRPDRADFSAPNLPIAVDTIDTVAGAEVLDDDVEVAVRQHLEAWTAESNGRAEALCVAGGPAEALGAIGLSRARITAIAPSEALVWLAWAGASGGAHGKRRGTAMGRYGTWWILAALADELDAWPVPAAALGERAASLDWFWFDDGSPPSGWNLNVVAHDPDESVSWVMHATDSA